MEDVFSVLNCDLCNRCYYEHELQRNLCSAFVNRPCLSITSTCGTSHDRSTAGQSFTSTGTASTAVGATSQRPATSQAILFRGVPAFKTSGNRPMGSGEGISLASAAAPAPNRSFPPPVPAASMDFRASAASPEMASPPDAVAAAAAARSTTSARLNGSASGPSTPAALIGSGDASSLLPAALPQANTSPVATAAVSAAAPAFPASSGTSRSSADAASMAKVWPAPSTPASLETSQLQPLSIQNPATGNNSVMGPPTNSPAPPNFASSRDASRDASQQPESSRDSWARLSAAINPRFRGNNPTPSTGAPPPQQQPNRESWAGLSAAPTLGAATASQSAAQHDVSPVQTGSPINNRTSVGNSAYVSAAAPPVASTTTTTIYPTASSASPPAAAGGAVSGNGAYPSTTLVLPRSAAAYPAAIRPLQVPGNSLSNMCFSYRGSVTGSPSTVPTAALGTSPTASGAAAAGGSPIGSEVKLQGQLREAQEAHQKQLLSLQQQYKQQLDTLNHTLAAVQERTAQVRGWDGAKYAHTSVRFLFSFRSCTCGAAARCFSCFYASKRDDV